MVLTVSPAFGLWFLTSYAAQFVRSVPLDSLLGLVVAAFVLMPVLVVALLAEEASLPWSRRVSRP
jgi:hypothetical protein